MALKEAEVRQEAQKQVRKRLLAPAVFLCDLLHKVTGDLRGDQWLFTCLRPWGFIGGVHVPWHASQMLTKPRDHARGWNMVCGVQSLLCTVVNDVDGL